MNDLKILFDIDVDKKKVTFFIKQGSLKEWVARAMKNFPKIDITKKGSELLTEVMARTMQHICVKNNVEGWEKFEPNFILFKSKAQLPIQLR